MLMIIFGAGASYDSYVSRPPLTDALFSDRARFNEALQHFDKAQPLIAKLRYLRGTDTLEQMLERVEGESKGYVEGRKHLAAVRYYIQWVISECEGKWHSVHLGGTNHKVLFNGVERWRSAMQETVCIVTFNYDRVIGESLSIFDIDFEKMSHYIEHPFL